MAEIELIVLDVDGCLSNGQIVYSENGEELKSFNVKDGLGIATWIKMGKRIAIITGRSSSIVRRRAKELKVDYCEQGVRDKRVKLKEIIDELNIGWESVACIGDDYNDYLMLQSVGLSFTPSDGIDDIKEIVDIVLSKNGGDGVVREMIDFIINRDNKRDDFRKLWLVE